MLTRVALYSSLIYRHTVSRDLKYCVFFQHNVRSMN